jgi:hypothetical protein
VSISKSKSGEDVAAQGGPHYMKVSMDGAHFSPIKLIHRRHFPLSNSLGNFVCNILGHYGDYREDREAIRDIFDFFAVNR